MEEEIERYSDDAQLVNVGGSTDVEDIEIPEALVSDWSDRLSAVAASPGLSMDDFEDLKGEMEEWLDNIPENLQGGTKYEEVSSCVDALDSLVGMEFEIPEMEDGGAGAFMLKPFRVLIVDLEDAAENLEAVAAEAESVEFPGMF
jgi:hypothetical protein